MMQTSKDLLDTLPELPGKRLISQETTLVIGVFEQTITVGDVTGLITVLVNLEHN
jgi:hypothetical protein